MGLNTYMTGAGGVGYTTGSTANGVWVDIDGKPGSRVAIQSYYLNPQAGGSAGKGYVMCTLDKATCVSVASNATTVTVATFSSAPATGATVVIVLDDGTYQWTTVASTASTTSVPIASALTDTATSGAMYYLGLYSTSGNALINTGNTATSNQAYGSPGLFFGKYKGAPVRIGHINTAASLSSTVDYVTYAYMNV